MPTTVDVVAKELHVLTEFTVVEIGMLKMAMCMCESTLVGKTEEQSKAWDYFVNKFYPYIEKLDQDLKKHGD